MYKLYIHNKTATNIDRLDFLQFCFRNFLFIYFQSQCYKEKILHLLVHSPDGQAEVKTHQLLLYLPNGSQGSRDLGSGLYSADSAGTWIRSRAERAWNTIHMRWYYCKQQLFTGCATQCWSLESLCLTCFNFLWSTMCCLQVTQISYTNRVKQTKPGKHILSKDHWKRKLEWLYLYPRFQNNDFTRNEERWCIAEKYQFI